MVLIAIVGSVSSRRRRRATRRTSWLPSASLTSTPRAALTSTASKACASCTLNVGIILELFQAGNHCTHADMSAHFQMQPADFKRADNQGICVTCCGTNVKCTCSIAGQAWAAGHGQQCARHDAGSGQGRERLHCLRRIQALCSAHAT